jgi:hypothetical protein
MQSNTGIQQANRINVMIAVNFLEIMLIRYKVFFKKTDIEIGPPKNIYTEVDKMDPN